jgi:hypothetical protein
LDYGVEHLLPFDIYTHDGSEHALRASPWQGQVAFIVACLIFPLLDKLRMRITGYDIERLDSAVKRNVRSHCIHTHGQRPRIDIKAHRLQIHDQTEAISKTISLAARFCI